MDNSAAFSLPNDWLPGVSNLNLSQQQRRETGPQEPGYDWNRFAEAYVDGKWDPSRVPFEPQSSSTASSEPFKREADDSHDLLESLATSMQHVYEKGGYLPTYAPATNTLYPRIVWYSKQLQESDDTSMIRQAHRLAAKLGKVPFVCTKLMAPKRVMQDPNDACCSALYRQGWCPFQVVSEWTDSVEPDMHMDETGFDHSMWSHAMYLEQNQVLLVPDALQDWRFARHPRRQNLRFFACTPIYDMNQEVIGVFGIGDKLPLASLDSDLVGMILDVSHMLAKAIELAASHAQILRRDRLKTCTELFLQHFLKEPEPDACKPATEGLMPLQSHAPQIDMHLCNGNYMYIYDFAAESLRTSMDVSGVVFLDLSNFVLSQKLNALDNTKYENVVVHSRMMNWNWQQNDTAKTDAQQAHVAALQVLGSSEVDVHVPCARNDPMDVDDIRDLCEIIATESLGVRYRRHAPSVIRRLVPRDMEDLLAVPLSGAERQPSLLILVYSRSDSYSIMLDQMLHTAMQHVRAIGLMAINVVTRQSVLLADRAKSTFISNMSHELRTPLHGILASSDLLSDTRLDRLQRFYLETIESCGNGLLELVNHVLDFTKLYSGASNTSRRKNIQMTDFDLSRLVQEVCDSSLLGQQVSVSRPHDPQGTIGSMYDPQSAPSTASTSSDSAPNDLVKRWSALEVVVLVEKRMQGWYVHSDCGGLRRVLMNLMGNALKFTTNGFVEVSLRGTDMDEHMMRISLRVRDSGCGISRAFLDKQLFQPFSQENPLRGGTGLGLSIVNEIVASFDGGVVNVDSAQGVGTDIVVSCNLRKAPLPEARTSHVYVPQLQVQQRFVVHLIGFSGGSEGMHMLRQSLTNYLTTWWGFRVKVHTEDEEEEEAIASCTSVWDHGILLMNNYSVFMERLVEYSHNCRGKLALPPLVLLADLYNKHLFAKACEDYERAGGLAHMLLKPSGPARMEDVLQSCVEQWQQDPVLQETRTMGVAISGAGNTDGQPKDPDTVRTEKQVHPTTPPRITIPPKFRQSEPSTPCRTLSLLRSDEGPWGRQAVPTATMSQAPMDDDELVSPDQAVLERSLREAEAFDVEQASVQAEAQPQAGPQATESMHSNHGPSIIPNVNPAEPSAFHVLFADDNPVNRQVLGAYLRKLNVPYVEARDGGEGIAAFSSKPAGYFDLILMDYSMPNIDGLCATLVIRQIEKQRSIDASAQARSDLASAHAGAGAQAPVSSSRANIYILSGASTEEVMRQGFGAGADGYLVKPLSFKVFVSLLKSVGHSSS